MSTDIIHAITIRQPYVEMILNDISVYATLAQGIGAPASLQHSLRRRMRFSSFTTSFCEQSGLWTTIAHRACKVFPNH